MPAKSQAQYKKMFVLRKKGEITKKELDDFTKGVNYKKLPRRIDDVKRSGRGTDARYHNPNERKPMPKKMKKATKKATRKPAAKAVVNPEVYPTPWDDGANEAMAMDSEVTPEEMMMEQSPMALGQQPPLPMKKAKKQPRGSAKKFIQKKYPSAFEKGIQNKR